HALTHDAVARADAGRELGADAMRQVRALESQRLVLDPPEERLHLFDRDRPVGHDLAVLPLPVARRTGDVSVRVELDRPGRAEILDRLAGLDQLERLLELPRAGA